MNDSNMIPLKSDNKKFYVSILFLILAVGIGFYFSQKDDPSLLGDSIYSRPKLEELNDLERARWNASVEFSFSGSTPVSVVRYNGLKFDLDQVFQKDEPVVIKGMPVNKKFIN